MIRAFLATILIFGIANIIGLAAVSADTPPPAKCPAGQTNKAPAGSSRLDCQLDNPAPDQLVDYSDFGKLLQRIIRIFLAFAGAIAVIFLMVGGFQYIMARGNEEATEKAKKTITGAIIGIVIIVMAFAIVLIVNELLTGPVPT